MKIQFIKEGRFDNAIWIKDLPKLVEYTNEFAISIETAVELMAQLRTLLRENVTN